MLTFVFWGGGITQQLFLFGNPLTDVGVNEFVKLNKDSPHVQGNPLNPANYEA